MNPIKKRRLLAEINQAELARRAGISRNSLSLYETGKISPRIVVLDKIAKSLDCSTKDLLEIEG